jgi:signal transduction histidine kinase
MNLFVLGCFLNGVTVTVLTLFLLVRAPGDPRRTTYGFYGLTIALWSAGFGAAELTEHPETAHMWLRLALTGGILVPVAYFHNILTILNLVEQHRVLLKVSYGLSGLFLLSNLTPLLIQDIKPMIQLPHWPRPGLVFHLFMGWFFLAVSGTTSLLITAFRLARGSLRYQYLSVMIASMIGFAGASTTIPLFYEIPVMPNGVILVSIGAAILAYTVIRYRLLDFSVETQEGLTFLVQTSFVTVPSLLILIAAQRAYFGLVNAQFSIMLFTLFAFVLVIEAPLKGYLQTMITRTLFRDRYEMYTRLSDFSKTVGAILNLDALSERIVRVLATVMGIRTVSLFLHDKERGEYRLLSAHGLADEKAKSIRLKTDHLLPVHFGQTRHILVQDDFHRTVLHPNLSLEVRQSLVQALEALDAEVCIPFINKTRTVGFCALGTRKDDRTYSEEDLACLTSLAQHVAIALDNGLLYEELRRSYGLMRRADQLRSFHIVAGGFAHSVRDPLSSIRTLLQHAPELRADPDFSTHLTAMAAEGVARIERLIHEVLDYARNRDSQFAQERLNDVVASCLVSIAGQTAKLGIHVEARLGSDLMPVCCNRHQIRQVLLNLLANALEAMASTGGWLTVATSRATTPSPDGWIRIQVTDSGCGIAADHLEHIFDPFFTTKHDSVHAGMGLGLVVAHQIVQDHCGLIEVDSTPGRGTSFSVTLPVNPITAGRRFSQGLS